MPMAERCFITLVGGILVIGIFILSGEFVPDLPKTQARMRKTKNRILQYCKSTGSIPESLDVLPWDEPIEDDWGRELIYTVTGMTVELRSQGSDRKPGGDGDAKDQIRTFSLTNSDGRWSEENVRWEHNKYLEPTAAKDGARQPDTDPDSKSCGNQKPEPESEGRSQ